MYGLNLLRICGNPLVTDHMTEIGNRLLGELALAKLDLPLIMGQQSKNLPKVLNMFLECPVVDQNVIKEYQSALAPDSIGS